MNRQCAEIIPFDTLFFRDGRSFTMGEDVNASGIFPPPPSVLYGALRGYYFSKDIMGYADFLNDKSDKTKALAIHRICLKLQTPNLSALLFPMPLDTYPVEDSKKRILPEFLDLTETNPIASASTTVERALSKKQSTSQPEGGPWYISHVKGYLEGKDFFQPEDISNYMHVEAETGLGRTGRIAREGHLFRIPFVRPGSIKKKKDTLFEEYSLSLLIEFSGINIGNDPGTLSLGGEGKKATIIPCEEPFTEISPANFEKCEELKLWLLTPAWFEEGSIPVEYFSSLGLTIITAAIGKPRYQGGWDIRNRRPKPTLQMVPEGSVYYVKISDFKRFNKTFPKGLDSTISQSPGSDAAPQHSELARQGFGWTVLAKIT